MDSDIFFMENARCIHGREIQILSRLEARISLVADLHDRSSYLLKESEESEVKLISELSPHPNIVKVVSSSLDPPLLLLEKASGDSLEAVSPADPLKMVFDIALALKHMHTRSIVHMNLRPSIIYEHKKVYIITSFETACESIGQLSKLDIERIQGWNHFDSTWKAPELERLKEYDVVDFKVDVWNLGLLLYFSIFRKPFEYTYSVRNKVSNKTKELLDMMLNRNPLKRADIPSVLVKLEEQPSIKINSLSSGISCISKFFSPSNSTFSLLRDSIYKEGSKITQNTSLLSRKAWKNCKKSQKFFEEFMKLKNLDFPPVRIRACLLLLSYIQGSPVSSYSCYPGISECLQYIESYCSVRPGHPLKNELFYRLTNALCKVIKEKYYLTKAHTHLFNGKFYRNVANAEMLMDDQYERTIEVLLSYWSTVIEVHEFLLQKSSLSFIRKSVRKALMNEQSSLLSLLAFFYDKKPGHLIEKYTKLYHRARVLFQTDDMVIPSGVCEVLEDSPDSERNLQLDMKNVKVLKQIAKGKTCSVWIGLMHKTYVAIKYLENNDNEFTRELDLLMNLRHPNIILLMGVHMEDPVCLIMEFCKGGDLFHLLHKKKNVKLCWKQKIKILQDVARGMVYLHYNGYIHRDLKSLNLLLDTSVNGISDPVNVKITDFGLSREESAFMTGNIGTCHWMAPEMLAGQKYSYKADVFSYGIVMYEVLSRQVPYKGMSINAVRAYVLDNDGRPNLSKIPDNCPKPLKKLMTMCWRTSPLQRPSFSSVVDILNSISVPEDSKI